jgi:hypothetical protein
MDRKMQIFTPTIIQDSYPQLRISQLENVLFLDFVWVAITHLLAGHLDA